MAGGEEPFAARRILVAVDASAASLAALAAASVLAARLGAELRGLFVEDEDLVRLAGLPFSDLVRSPGGARERFDPADAELALRAIGARARDAFERVARRHGIARSFRISRGRVAPVLLAAAEEVDLVVPGAAGHGRPRRGAVGETARATAARARPPVLLLARGARLDGAVVAVDDGTPGGVRALAAARRIAPEREPPTIVCTGAGGTLALVAPIAHLAPALAVLPPGAAGAAEPLLATGIAVLLAR